MFSLRDAVPRRSHQNHPAPIKGAALFSKSVILPDAPLTVSASAMSGASSGKVIVVWPSDVSLKISDITEKIIAGIMDAGEVDVIGVGEAMLLVCSALNLSCEIAKINISQISLENVEDQTLGKTGAIYVHLTQKDSTDYEKLVAEEEKTMDNLTDRTISVGREIPTEKLLTRSLMALARFDEIKLIAAGSSINEAILLALKLSTGQITRDPVGVDLVYVYSINMRNDPAKRISAISIYLKKGVPNLQSDFLKKITSTS